jgi:hypothetical protein
VSFLSHLLALLTIFLPDLSRQMSDMRNATSCNLAALLSMIIQGQEKVGRGLRDDHAPEIDRGVDSIVGARLFAENWASGLPPPMPFATRGMQVSRTSSSQSSGRTEDDDQEEGPSKKRIRSEAGEEGSSHSPSVA